MIARENSSGRQYPMNLLCSCYGKAPGMPVLAHKEKDAIRHGSSAIVDEDVNGNLHF
jgi:hypothetical protein